jgi:hypothetical protein
VSLSNNLVDNEGDGKGILFQVGEAEALQTLNGGFTSVSLSGTFQQNVVK